MKLDPNLEKFRDANIQDIKAGNINPTLQQAKDYLYNLLGQQNKKLVEAEMDVFAKQIKKLAPPRKRQ